MCRHGLLCRIALLAIASAPVLLASAQPVPSLAGKWEGTLKDDSPAMSREVRNRPVGIRTVLTITPAAGGTYTVTQLAVDVNKPIELTDVVVEGDTVRWKVPVLGATYEGKLSADGAWIKGKWMRFRSASAVNFKRIDSSP